MIRWYRCLRNTSGSRCSGAVSDTEMAWDPDVYMKFAGERTRPAVELLARVPVTAPERVIDLSCGPGNSTAVLAARWPHAGARLQWPVTAEPGVACALPIFRLKAEATRCCLGIVSSWDSYCLGIRRFRLQPEDRAGDSDSAVNAASVASPKACSHRGRRCARRAIDQSFLQPQPSRRAISGLIRDARHEGPRQASAATTTNNAATPA